MPTTLLVNARRGEEPEAIGDSGVEVLARYPDMVLVRGTDEQVSRLRQSGADVIPLPEQPVLVSGNSFTFAAQSRETAPTQPGRTAYYLVELAGPPAPEWLRELGGEIHDSLPNFTLLVGIRPERLDDLRARPWVEDITPYRPTMKVSPKLPVTDEPRLVEIVVFAGERADTTAAQIRETGGTVVSATARSLVATVDGQTITRLADSPGVQVILPYNLPEPHNDRATQAVDQLGQLFEQAYEAGARIHTNSWGAPTLGEYTENARAADDFMWRHPDTLILFPAGNEGVDEDRGGVIDPDSVGSPGTAKNCLTVGASENDRPHDSTPLPGRDATPLVAGAAALVRQHLVEQRHHQPSGALVKAFLVNGAAPMRGQFPGEVMPGNNNVTGFGRVALAATVTPGMLFADDPADAVATGETREYQVDGVEPGEPLAITLVWTDAPSQPGNGSLVNRLYLQVLTPIGTVLDGDLTPFPLATNNVQRITIQAPSGGRYTIRVHGISVVIDSPGAAPTGNLRQDFALAVANGDTLTKEARS